MTTWKPCAKGAVLLALLLAVSVPPIFATQGPVPDPEEISTEDIVNWAKDGTSDNFAMKLVSELENDPHLGAARLVFFLKSGDIRLVRNQITREHRGKQRQFLETQQFASVLRLLAPQQPIEVRSKVAEAIKLLAMQNPEICRLIGLHGWMPGMHGMKDLVRIGAKGTERGIDKITTIASEHAIEAIWALVRSSIDTLELAKSDDAIPMCSDIIKSSASPRAKMWAAACLKHLVKDYYNTPTGAYASDARKTVDNAPMRKRMTKDKPLLQALLHMASLGRVMEDTPRQQWPSVALEDERTTKHVQAWAAAAALGALGSGEEGGRNKVLGIGAAHVLCPLLQSPDPMESSEAREALQVLDDDCSTLDDYEEHLHPYSAEL